MAGYAVHVEGLRELDAAFRKVNRDVSKGFRAELLRAAKPVAESARQKISRFQGASLGTIRPRASATGVFVTQNARKVTGLRGDYGTEQLEDLVSALAENEEKVVVELEKALDRVGVEAGF